MRPLDWAEIEGWESDDHAAAWAAFCVTAGLFGWDGPDPAPGQEKALFEQYFRPYEVVPAGRAHFTAYYEPELPGSRYTSARFHHPLYAMPEGMDALQPWHSRSEILASDMMGGRELVYLESAIEAFLAQVQGSVRVRLDEGGTMRLGFAGKNGHPYRSIGAELVRRGVAPAEEMTPQTIRHWCKQHPDQVPDLLNHNPSFVFFRVLDLPEESGPIGAMGRPVTSGRSLAVDPEIVTLGSPVWVNCPGLPPRLTVAQDIGSAIRGAGRGDIFLGSGPEAGLAAGAVNAHGAMIVLRRVA